MLCVKVILTTEQTIFNNAPLRQQFSPNVGLNANAQITDSDLIGSRSFGGQRGSNFPLLSWIHTMLITANRLTIIVANTYDDQRLIRKMALEMNELPSHPWRYLFTHFVVVDAVHTISRPFKLIYRHTRLPGVHWIQRVSTPTQLIVSLLRASECVSLLSTHNYISQLQCKLHSNLEPESEKRIKKTAFGSTVQRQSVRMHRSGNTKIWKSE